MISLKEACKKVLSENPNKYIHPVNEYGDGYAFILSKNKERATHINGIAIFTTADRKNGTVTDNLLPNEVPFKGDFTQYTGKDSERL